MPRRLRTINRRFDAHLRRCRELRNDLDVMVSHTLPDYVYWINTSTRGRFDRVVLQATPINVSEELNTHLFEKLDSIIMTSATLATNQNFNYFRNRIGLSDSRELLVGSPFNYQEQVEIHIPSRDAGSTRSQIHAGCHHADPKLSQINTWQSLCPIHKLPDDGLRFTRGFDLIWSSSGSTCLNRGKGFRVTRC